MRRLQAEQEAKLQQEESAELAAFREAVDAACRRQVILAGELRRALRPAMR